MSEKYSFVIFDDSYPVQVNSGNPISYVMPEPFELDDLCACLTTAQATGNVVTVDVLKNGVSVLATKLTFDNTQPNSRLASAPFVFAAPQQVFNLNDRVQIVTTQIGDGTAAGLKVTLLGRQPAVTIASSGGGGSSAPTVTAISPNSGPVAGGTAVSITGTNFTGATGVTIGGQTVTNLAVVNSTTITGTTPAGTAGGANVAVTTFNGTGSSSNLFTYQSSGGGGQFGAPRKIGKASPGNNQSSATITTTGALASGDLLVVAATTVLGGSTGKFSSMSINGTVLTSRKQSSCVSSGDTGFTEIWELFCPTSFPVGAIITINANGTSGGGIGAVAGAITGPVAFDTGNVANSLGNATQNVPVSTGALSTQPEVIVAAIGSNLGGTFSHNNDAFGSAVIDTVSGGTYVSLELAMLVVSTTTSVTYNPTTSGSGAYVESAVASYR